MAVHVDGVNRTGASMAAPSDTAPRTAYRHGDLRNALIAAGVDLARGGGPTAVTLREATRRAGVSPNAAYRHFTDRDALLGAVSDACLAQVAAEMADEIARSAPPDRSAAAAAAELDSVGRAYVHFALREPGLFAAAFTVHVDPGAHPSPPDAPPGPYGLLVAALDHAVACGALAPERRTGAEALAWSSVHGFALLLLEGPLRSVPAAQREPLLDGLLRMVREGLFTG